MNCFSVSFASCFSLQATCTLSSTTLLISWRRFLMNHSGNLFSVSGGLVFSNVILAMMLSCLASFWAWDVSRITDKTQMSRIHTNTFSQLPFYPCSTPFITGSRVSLMTCLTYRLKLLPDKPFTALWKNFSSETISNCLILRYKWEKRWWMIDWHWNSFYQHVSGVTMYSTIKRHNHEQEEERVKLGLMPRKYASLEKMMTLGLIMFQLWVLCVMWITRDTSFGWTVSLVQLLIAVMEVMLLLLVMVVSWKC